MRNTSDLNDGFILSCPVSDTPGTPVREIRKRGNIPLVLQQDVLIELKRSDMLESWRTTCAMGRKRSHDLIQQAASRISMALEDEDTCDVAELAQDMTAFFVLALHQKGLDPAQASRFCSLAWGQNQPEQLSVKRY
jgi:hypothetical protein